MSRMFYFCVTTMLMFVAFFGGYDVSAQGDADPADAAREASEEAERRRPLPTYYGKIGVTDEQREQLYGIRDEYQTQIDALQRQIRQLIRERDERMEKLLTPGQKLRLQELREEARRRSRDRQATPATESDASAADSDDNT